MSSGSDRMNFEEQGVAAASFVPPIAPPVSGNPGPDRYLQTDIAGLVAWALKPQAMGLGLDYVYDPSAAATLHPVYKTLPELMAAVSAGPQCSRVLFTWLPTDPVITLPVALWNIVDVHPFDLK